MRHEGNTNRGLHTACVRAEAQGLKSLFPMRELALIGIAEVLPHLPRLVKRINQTAATICEMKPDIVVTVDAPSFTCGSRQQAARLGHSHRALCRTASSGPGARPREDSPASAWIISWRSCRSKSPSSPSMAFRPTMSVTQPSNGVAGDGKSFREVGGIADTALLLCVKAGKPGQRSPAHAAGLGLLLGCSRLSRS